MKKEIALAFILLFGISTKAQWINSLTVVPSNPKTTDQISILANLSFSAGPCDDHSQYMSSLGTNYSASALHCLGLLSFICNHTDTFMLGQLPSGLYHFTFNVNEGGGPSPCSPGIVAGPLDSISFFVSNPTSIKENKLQLIKASYNKLNSSLDFEFENMPVNGSFQILNLEGKILYSERLLSTKNSYELNSLKPGLYLITVQNKGNYYSNRFVVSE